MTRTCLLVIILFNVFSSDRGFYIPGVLPVEFSEKSTVEVKAIKLTSVKTQLPFDYYSLGFCRPTDHLEYKKENLGEIFRGDRIVNTPFVVRMKENEACHLLCASEEKMNSLSVEQTDLMIQRIKEEYRVHLLVDNLPCATRTAVGSDGQYTFVRGYPLGFAIANEVTILLSNFSVILITAVDFCEQSLGLLPVLQQILICHSLLMYLASANSLYWSYSVLWRESDIQWTNRWDKYLAMHNTQIHWLSIVNSTVTVLFLAGVLGAIIVRIVRKDIAQYNKLHDSDDALEESGWKLIHGDIFRPPPRATLLVALVGSGIQVFGMTLSTIVLAAIGMLSPSSRGALMSTALFLYCFMGLFSGYFAGRLYKTFRLTNWKKAAVKTACLLPGFLFLAGFVLNMLAASQHASNALSFSSMLSLLSMFICIDIPLVMVAFRFGFRKQPYVNPVRTNQIPRQVPEQPVYLNLMFSMLFAGIVPFLAVFLELFFIFSAMWQNQFYYLFGFLFIVFVILVVSTALVSVVIVYFLLAAENYHWWWRAFFIGGSQAIYVFLYSVYYYMTKLQMVGFTAKILYFSYTFLISLTFWLLAGTVGFYAAYAFVRKIYSAVKID
ncbi:Transmembrane 9 superfamily member 4 [Trichuris trichiura]|uniref:Transmembrane 9 superfamily member n=1 Tax=Trichuris trichiura TaxID=36087 RepID=A0A077Z546_TRITR|nr:Transmembrane 9 superfamily member 4 [Trichuris trichiura]